MMKDKRKKKETTCPVVGMKCCCSEAERSFRTGCRQQLSEDSLEPDVELQRLLKKKKRKTRDETPDDSEYTQL